MCKTVCAQERARARRKAIFELRAATIIRNNPLIVYRTLYRIHMEPFHRSLYEALSPKPRSSSACVTSA